MPNPRYYPVTFIDSVPSPAAGSEFTYRRRTSAWILVKSIRFQLATDANVASRRASISVIDGNFEFLRMAANVVQAATQTLIYCGYQGASAGVAGATVVANDWPNDGVWIPPGGSLSSICANMQVGDAYTGIALQVVEMPQGPDLAFLPFAQTLLNETS